MEDKTQMLRRVEEPLSDLRHAASGRVSLCELTVWLEAASGYTKRNFFSQKEPELQ